MTFQARPAAATLAVAAAVLIGCDGNHAPPPPLPAGVTQLVGLNANLPSTDLEPLRAIVGNSIFVGLGESIHTSGGYERAKHRVAKYLIEEMGFRLLAFETYRTASNS